MLEIQNVVEIRPPPAIDRLVGIARHGQVGKIDRKRPHDCILSQVGVLVFVHQNVAERSSSLDRTSGFSLQQRGNMQQQVVEIHGVDASNRA